jgi:hypothetical protein
LPNVIGSKGLRCGGTNEKQTSRKIHGPQIRHFVLPKTDVVNQKAIDATNFPERSNQKGCVLISPGGLILLCSHHLPSRPNSPGRLSGVAVVAPCSKLTGV